MEHSRNYIKGFLPYALCAFVIGIVGGFSTVLGPAFVQDMGISYNNTTWTALAQAMSTAACAPILGKCGDIFGQRRALSLGLAVFTLGNILSALAGSLFFMLVARFIVGIGTAAMTPAVIAYIITHFPQGRIARGFSVYMLISSASVIAGPSLGGLVISSYGWRTMLWICSGICIAVLCICLLLPAPRERSLRGFHDFDWAGAVLVLVFFSLVLCIPSFGQNIGWTSPEFIVVLASAMASLAALYISEKKAKAPILSGRFIARRSFVLSVLALFLTQGLMQANMTSTIIFVNYTQAGNSVISGYAISVMYLGMSLGAIILGPLADRFEARRVLVFSFLLTALGCGLMLFFSDAASSLLLMASLGILGFGLGANGTIFMRVVLSGLSPEEAGSGTGAYGLFRDLAAPFGVAVFVPFFTNRSAAEISAGVATAQAAVASIHALALAELFCVFCGIISVLFLPREKSEKADSA